MLAAHDRPAEVLTKSPGGSMYWDTHAATVPDAAGHQASLMTTRGVPGACGENCPCGAMAEAGVAVLRVSA